GGPCGRATGIGVLDNDGRGFFEFERDPCRRIEVEKIGIRKLPALENVGLAKPAGVNTRHPEPAGWLMRVLAISKIPNLRKLELDAVRRRALRCGCLPFEAIAVGVNR